MKHDIGLISSSLNMTQEQAKDICDLFDKLKQEGSKLIKGDDYIGNWELNWCRYMNWETLVCSEIEQEGWEGERSTWREQAEKFCLNELGNSIFKLPCGMYAQYVC